MDYDLIIVGAGITGLSSAYHIKRENPDLSILIVDRAHTYAQGNTAKSAAGFRDVFTSGASYALSSSTAAFYGHIQKDLHVDIGMKYSGYLFLLDSERNAEALESLSRKTSIKEIDLRDLESIGISASINESIGKVLGIGNIKRSFLAYNCGILEPDLIAKFYFEELSKMGVQFMFDTDIKRLNLEPAEKLNFPGEPFIWQEKQISSLESSRGILKADQYILATDVWTTSILDPAGIDSHIRPKKRQLFRVSGKAIGNVVTDTSLGTESFPFTVFPKGVYIRPNPKEKAFWAGVADDIGRDFTLTEDPQPEDNFYTYNVYQIASAYMNAFLDSKVIGSWAGYYSYNTIDGNPYIFRELNTIVATGTSGSGILKGDAIGTVVASLYGGKEYADLYGGKRLKVSDLGVTNRNVGTENLVL